MAPAVKVVSPMTRIHRNVSMRPVCRNSGLLTDDYVVPGWGCGTVRALQLAAATSL
jgi:hypothetical protein